MIAFSDFPPPDDFAIFMHNTKVLEYFHLYAEKFDLVKHICYNAEVVFITKGADFQKSGRYLE